jgi:hypothetical protein
MYWKNESDDENVMATAKLIIEAIDEDATARRQEVPDKYLKYALGF